MIWIQRDLKEHLVQPPFYEHLVFIREVGQTTDISPFKAFKALKVIAMKTLAELYLNAKDLDIL